MTGATSGCGADAATCDACSEPTGHTYVVLASGVCSSCAVKPPPAAVRAFLNTMRPANGSSGGASDCGRGWHALLPLPSCRSDRDAAVQCQPDGCDPASSQ